MGRMGSLHQVVTFFAAAVLFVPSLTGTAAAQGDRITILEPKATGFKENQNHIPVLVQRGFVTYFSRYMPPNSVLDQESTDRINVELMSERYDDDAAGALITAGREIPTNYYMTGSITKTTMGYAFQVSINRTSDKTTRATYMGTFNYWQLEDQTAVQKATLELLPQFGVTLTASAQQELAGSAKTEYLQSRTALARAVTAERRGGKVAALSYFMEAATFDPTLTYATNRISTLQANISSGYMGDNIRDDIQWRRQWVERLKETEEFINNFTSIESMPYTLFYVKDGLEKYGRTNYQNETVSMSMGIHLHASEIWTLSIERTLQAVYDGLRATGKAVEWGLANWPQQAVTDLNLHEKRKDNFNVTFELLNDRNNVIGSAILQESGSWELNRRGRPDIKVSTSTKIDQMRDGMISFTHVLFNNINPDNITDHLTVRVASVNGIEAEAAAIDGVLNMRAITQEEFANNAGYVFEMGKIQGFAQRQNFSQGQLLALQIPDNIWGEPVISIGAKAFYGYPVASIAIPNSIKSIEAEAFKSDHYYDSRHSYSTGKQVALIGISIGENVDIAENSFQFSERYIERVTERTNCGENCSNWSTQDKTLTATNTAFKNYYARNGKKAGKYYLLSRTEHSSGGWIYGEDALSETKKRSEEQIVAAQKKQKWGTWIFSIGLIAVAIAISAFNFAQNEN